MALTHDTLTDTTYVADSAAAVYTCPASTKAYIKGIILHNNNTTTEDVSLYRVNSGGSASAANRIAKMGLLGNDTIDWDRAAPIILSAGDTLQADTITASKVTITIIGATEAV